MIAMIGGEVGKLLIGPDTTADSGTASGTVCSIAAPEHGMVIMAEISSGATAIMDGRLDGADGIGKGTETDTGRGISRVTVPTVFRATNIRGEGISISDKSQP